MRNSKESWFVSDYSTLRVLAVACLYASFPAYAVSAFTRSVDLTQLGFTLWMLSVVTTGLVWSRVEIQDQPEPDFLKAKRAVSDALFSGTLKYADMFGWGRGIATTLVGLQYYQRMEPPTYLDAAHYYGRGVGVMAAGTFGVNIYSLLIGEVGLIPSLLADLPWPLFELFKATSGVFFLAVGWLACSLFLFRVRAHFFRKSN